MATKVPIGAGLSLASPPCASNVRSLVLKSAFFGHGGCPGFFHGQIRVVLLCSRSGSSIVAILRKFGRMPPSQPLCVFCLIQKSTTKESLKEQRVDSKEMWLAPLYSLTRLKSLLLDYISIFLAVGALKVRGIRIARSSTYRCNGHGGGALGTQMNLFDRFARVVKSYANAILSSFEDPEKILEQTVLEMNDDLTKMRQATAQVLASQKQLENRYKAAQQASEDWYKRAQLALGKGDEDLAREALKRRKSYAMNE
ncbi:Membrane-associated protein VIPP1, chloroplastic [Vitis vinifera]|uniref:Membrane-associated protein VIPP1, chloroplastic n=1 Tax=Vitis vinifera TaxID=29760 RepID=A0A438GDB1_VITVI|nr:Membrane-associated protein VIPP1, chloroplastic [Vitis vinifera]